MCDYSAESVKSRKAAVGDKLVTAPISQHTIGLISPSDPGTAVCMLPGSKMTVAGISPGVSEKLGLKAGAVHIATFAQRDFPDHTYQFRDGLLFEGRTVQEKESPDGIVLFCSLGTGVEMSVETIPGVSDEPPPPAAVATEHPATVHIGELVSA